MWAPTSRHTNAYSHAYTTCTHLLGNPFKSISTTHFECTYSKTVVNIPNQRNQLKNCFRRMVEIPSIHAHFSCQPLKSFLIEAIPSCIVLSHKKGLDRVEFMDIWDATAQISRVVLETWQVWNFWDNRSFWWIEISGQGMATQLKFR